MSNVRPPHREQIEQQAALWTARLETGSLDPEERAALSDWLAADPEHGWVLSRYREMCSNLAAQIPVLLDSAEVDQVVARASRRTALRRWAAPLVAAAATVTIVATAVFLRPENVDTGPGERRALVLDDGSRVELNAETHLEIDLGRTARHVRLSQGEALFQVSRELKRAFVVDTPRGTVRVTGTAFNIRHTATDGVEVTVLEGSVQVATPRDATASLVAGQQAILHEDGISVSDVPADHAANVVAWRVGQAAFENEPLGEALARFVPYHSAPIEVSAPAGQLRVGGRHSLDDLDGFLSAIEIALPVSILRGENGAVRVLPRPQRRKEP